MSLGKLLSAAEACSLSLVRADCLPRSDDEILMGVGHPFDLCFETSAGRTAVPSPADLDFITFVLYLSVHSPSFLPLGLYQQL